MKDDNYITVMGFMRNELNLRGNELLVYALIYGFSQNQEDEFTGSVGYIADWIGTSKQTVFYILKKLTARQLIKKTEVYNNGVKFCRYKTLPVIKNLDGEVVKKFDGGSKKTLSNNIDDIDNNKNIEYIVYQYNQICKSLPKCTKITDNRKKKLQKRLEENTVDDIVIAFEKAEKSDFLSGRNGKWQACNFDWFIKNDENIAKVLEGTYDNKKSYSKDELELMHAYESIGSEIDGNGFNFGE